jgi:uncharacterized protein (TIGR02145 family)
MRTYSFYLLSVLSFTFLLFSGCKPEEVLSGKISGVVTDKTTNQFLQGTKLVLTPIPDSVNTASDGSYSFTNVKPGNYEVTASLPAYKSLVKPALVEDGKTTFLNFNLEGAPVPDLSAAYLDFGLDSSILHIRLANIGKAPFNYSITSNRDWITVYPFSGEVSDSPDTLTVSINKTGFTTFIQKGDIFITATNGTTVYKDTVPVFANGVMDDDHNYYNVIQIGTQMWMAENLNVGSMVSGGVDQSSFQTVKKYCYNNDDRNCKIYGGLYQWPELMQGAQSDTGLVGTVRGVCPVGWHVPTMKEWQTLTTFLNESVASLKIKEAGTTHWKSGNTATNESGFTALPGGMWDGSIFDLLTTHEYIWSSSADPFPAYRYCSQLEYNSERIIYKKYLGTEAAAVRCIKDKPATK